MGAGYDIGASASSSSGAQSGQIGDFNYTHNTGGGLSSVIPTLTADNAWIFYVVGGVVLIIGIALYFKFRK